MVGLAKGALESVIPYLHEREAFSQKIADFQVSKHTSFQPSKSLYHRHFHLCEYKAPSGYTALYS